MSPTPPDQTTNQYAMLADTEPDDDDTNVTTTNNTLTPIEHENLATTNTTTIITTNNEMTQIDNLESDITKTLYCKLFEDNIETEFDRQDAYYELERFQI